MVALVRELTADERQRVYAGIAQCRCLHGVLLPVEGDFIKLSHYILYKDTHRFSACKPICLLHHNFQEVQPITCLL